MILHNWTTSGTKVFYSPGQLLLPVCDYAVRVTDERKIGHARSWQDAATPRGGAARARNI